jgi:hypothetical protein
MKSPQAAPLQLPFSYNCFLQVNYRPACNQ